MVLGSIDWELIGPVKPARTRMTRLLIYIFANRADVMDAGFSYCQSLVFFMGAFSCYEFTAGQGRGMRSTWLAKRVELTEICVEMIFPRMNLRTKVVLNSENNECRE